MKRLRQERYEEQQAELCAIEEKHAKIDKDMQQIIEKQKQKKQVKLKEVIVGCSDFMQDVFNCFDIKSFKIFWWLCLFIFVRQAWYNVCCFDLGRRHAERG